MVRKSCLFMLFGLASTLYLFAQCPDKALLWKRLEFLKDSSNSTPADQLKELLSYEGKIRLCPSSVDSVYAFLYHSIGIAYYNEGDYLKTTQYLQKAITMISDNENHPAINPRKNIEYYYRLSKAYAALHEISEKIRTLDSCIAISIRANAVDLFCLAAMYQKLEYLFYIGDFQNCIVYTKMCESLAKSSVQSGTVAYETANGYILNSLGWRVIALLQIKNYNEAEEILVNKIKEIEREQDKSFLGTYLEKLARVEVHKGNYDQALFDFKRAFASEQRAGHVIACKGILNNMGTYIYFNHSKDYNKALSCYKKALDFNPGPQKLIDSSETLAEYLNIAKVYSYLGLHDSAMVYFQHAFDQVKPGLNESRLMQGDLDEFMHNKKNYYLADILIYKGDALKQQFRDTKQPEKNSQALRIYKIADLVLDRIKTDITELDSKLLWRNNSRHLYENAIEASYLENNSAMAFYFFEKSRSVLLTDQLNQLAKISNAEILKLAQIKKQKLLIERERDAPNTSSTRSVELESQLFNIGQELTRLDQSIRQNNPLYYQSTIDTTFINLNDVREFLLNDHDALLEIFSGDSSNYSLMVTKEKVYLDKINKEEFDSTVNSFISYLSDPSLLNSRFNDYVHTSSHLYQLIFKNRSLRAGRIIISPDAQMFPFEAMVTNGNADSPTYLLQDHAVSYTYSARYLLTQFFNNKSEHTGTFLGVAPIHFSSGTSLAALQGSDLSLTQISSYFNNSYNLTAVNASRNNFQKTFSGYSIIQLYTHASDSSNHGEPVIYFADSALYLSDLIPENKPNTRLAVLSACETGMGKLNLGEGVFSFNRGFASLGIPSSITNLWSVDNESTYRITELFYKYLSKGEPIDIALQKAKIDFIQHSSKQNKLPYYWAAAILAGKSDAIEVGKMHPWKDILIIFILVAISFLVLKRWNKIKF